MDVDVPESNETSQLFPLDSLEVSMGKEKGEEIKDNAEEDNDGSKVHANPNPENLVTCFSQQEEEEKMMEVEMNEEMPGGDETSQVFPPDNLEVSMGKEKGEENSGNV
eukprot:10352941-Ditylum_brightwellii.AAC.1